MIMAKSNGNYGRLLSEIPDAAFATRSTFATNARHGHAANRHNATSGIAKAVLTMHGLLVQYATHQGEASLLFFHFRALPIRATNLLCIKANTRHCHGRRNATINEIAHKALQIGIFAPQTLHNASILCTAHTTSAAIANGCCLNVSSF